MTQTAKVVKTIKHRTLSIREIANETNILEPNIRRIMGVGTKNDVFERIDRGIYRLYKDQKEIVFIRSGDAVDALPKLAEDGFKADMVFLDPPYKTRATHGWNRPMRYETINHAQFAIVTEALSQIVKTDNTPIYYMYSNALSGFRRMERYTNELLLSGFKIVSIGNYHKTFKNGQPVTNVLGNLAAPEGIMLLTKSGEFREKEEERKLNFTFIRPSVREYPTQKPVDLCRSLVRQGTDKDDMIIDPFLGSGAMGVAAVIEQRRITGIELNDQVLKDIVQPRLLSVV